MTENSVSTYKTRGIFVLIAVVTILILSSAGMPYVSTASTIQSSGEGQVTSPSHSVRADITPAHEWIAEYHNITFLNLTSFRITSIYDIHKALVNGSSRSADEIRDMINSSGGAQGIVGEALRSATRDMFLYFLEDLFPSINTSSDVTELTTSYDMASLQPESSSDPYSRPVVVNAGAVVQMNKESFDLGKYDIKDLNGLLMGMLTLGAHVLYEINLTVDGGHSSVIQINAPYDNEYGMDILADLDDRPGNIRREFNNTAHTSPIETKLDITFYDLTPHAPTEEKINLAGIIDMKNFSAVEFSAGVGIRSVSLADKLDEKVNWSDRISGLDYITADGIRALYYNGIISIDEINEKIDENTESISDILAQSMDSNVSVSINIDRNSLENITPLYDPKTMGSDIPVNVALASQVFEPGQLKEEGIDDEFIRGVMESGAVVKFDLDPPDIPYNDVYTIRLPEGIYLNNTPPGIRAVNVTSGRANYVWDAKTAAHIELVSNSMGAIKNRQRSEGNSRIDIMIALDDMDINSLKDIRAYIRLNVKAQIGYLALADFDIDLPENIELKFINADLIRMAIAKGFVNMSEIDNITEKISQEIYNFTGTRPDIKLTGLDWDGDPSVMDDNPPIKFSVKLDTSINLLNIGKESSISSFSLFKKRVPLPVKGIPGLETRYKLVPPRGIEFSSPSGTKYAKVRDEGGRTALIVDIPSSDPDGAKDMTVLLEVTIWFFLWQMCVPLVVTLVLFVTGVVFMIMKRKYKKKKGPGAVEDAYDGESYESGYNETSTLAEQPVPPPSEGPPSQDAPPPPPPPPKGADDDLDW